MPLSCCGVEWLGRLKWGAAGLDASVLFCSASLWCSRADYAIDDICGDAGEMVCDFDGSIGS